MTLPRAEALGKYWKIVPPPAVALAGIAAALGLKAPKPVAEGEVDLAQLMQDFGAAGIDVEVSRG